MNDEIAIKPSIQHFRLVAETEEKIKVFVDSFIKSKLIETRELLEEERVRWISFNTRGMSIKSLPKDLVEKLDLYHYKNGKVYFIYPSVFLKDMCRWRYRSIEDRTSLDDLESWITDIRLFKGAKKKEILKLIKEGVIIPIRRADYVEDNTVDKPFFKQEDFIKKYKINLDWFEKRFDKDILYYKEYAKREEVDYNRYYMINKYGQPVPIVDRDKYFDGLRAAKIEVDREKGQLKLITELKWNFRCQILIDIKTNSLVDMRYVPRKRFSMYTGGFEYDNC